MEDTTYLLDLLKRILAECEDNGTSNIYENLEGNPYRHDFPSKLGILLGEARIATGRLNFQSPLDTTTPRVVQ